MATYSRRCSHKVHFGLALTNPNLDQPTGDPEIDLMAGDDIAAHLNNVASSLNLDTYGVRISRLLLLAVSGCLAYIAEVSRSLITSAAHVGD